MVVAVVVQEIQVVVQLELVVVEQVLQVQVDLIQMTMEMLIKVAVVAPQEVHQQDLVDLV